MGNTEKLFIESCIDRECKQKGDCHCKEVRSRNYYGERYTEPQNRYENCSAEKGNEKDCTNSGAKEGDVLLLTKPLGIGVLTTAQRAELLSDEGKALAYRLMTTLNKSARDCMVKYRVHACTDVTGFGLLGHLYEMTQGSDLTAVLDTSAIHIIQEALPFAEMGILPEGMYRNRSFAEQAVDAGDTPLAVQDVLYDPQTAGGLMISVHPEDADALYEELKTAVTCAQRIGVMERAGEKRILLR